MADAIQQIIDSAIRDAVLAQRSEIYKRPDLVAFAGNGGDRINKKIQQRLKKLLDVPGGGAGTRKTDKSGAGSAARGGKRKRAAVSGIFDDSGSSGDGGSPIKTEGEVGRKRVSGKGRGVAAAKVKMEVKESEEVDEKPDVGCDSG